MSSLEGEHNFLTTVLLFFIHILSSSFPVRWRENYQLPFANQSFHKY